MRIIAVSYNAHGYRGGLDEVAGVLTRLHADVICLQECGSRRAVVRLASALGMEVASTHRPFNRVRNAVLFSVPWQATDRRVRDLSRDGGSMRRGFVAVTLGAHGVQMAVVSAHLGLSAKERERHAHELTDAVAGSRLPVILGVDLNDEPAGPAARWVGGLLVDAYGTVGEAPGSTFPARQPTDRIDYVFVNEDLRVLGAWVPTGGDVATASDHLPVVVDLELS